MTDNVQCRYRDRLYRIIWTYSYCTETDTNKNSIGFCTHFITARNRWLREADVFTLSVHLGGGGVLVPGPFLRRRGYPRPGPGQRYTPPQPGPEQRYPPPPPPPGQDMPPSGYAGGAPLVFSRSVGKAETLWIYISTLCLRCTSQVV